MILVITYVDVDCIADISETSTASISIHYFHILGDDDSVWNAGITICVLRKINHSQPLYWVIA
jgi:hypothetical protein